jgi:hypothetical protein
MSTIITKFSDYRIQSIEYFIDRIYTELQIRDLPGLFNNKIEIIKPTKQHPLATLMAVSLQDEGNPLRSGIIPAISVTPGDLTDIGFTLGQSFQPEVIDDDWIEDLQEYSGKGSREILEDLIITQKQIDLIIDTYEALESPEDMRVQKTEWRKDEIINVSVWSDSADIDMILGNLMDSILADIQVGFYGDNSKLMNFRYSTTKGLTNFNYGRILFGTEYRLTFTNTFCNYTVYSDDRITEHDFIGEFNAPGDE